MNNDIIRAVQDRLDLAEDNAQRARIAFRGQDMQKEYGQSGETRASILYRYEADVERWRHALADAKGSP
jgi:hypothetical protein